MEKRYINALLLILIVLAVAFTALFIGQRYFYHHHHHANHAAVDMHNYFHNQLGITAKQDTKLSRIEKHYNKKRQRLEETIRLANGELADAIKNTRSYSSEVQQAVDKIQKAMGELQESTLKHLFEMEAVLTDEQNLKFQQLITDALYENAKSKH